MNMNLSSNEEIAEKFYEFCVSANLSKSRIDKHRHANHKHGDVRVLAA